jgi:1,2-phenylacetyl-CoA epoxidase catalytic subunit
MTQHLEEVPDAYLEFAVPFFKETLIREQTGGNVFGYWMSKVPLDEELDELRFDLAKSAYDEMRHREICLKMLRHFGGQEAVSDMYQSWRDQGADNWQDRITFAFTQGIEDYIEFLTTFPLFGDLFGLYQFQDFAECSPDPLWTDAAESIVEDEKLHISLASEYLPLVVERHGDAALASIQRGLDTWMPVMFGLVGDYSDEWDSKMRQRMINSGFATLTIKDVHDHMWENVEDLIADIDGVDVPDLPADEYLSIKDVGPRCEQVVADRLQRRTVDYEP